MTEEAVAPREMAHWDRLGLQRSRGVPVELDAHLGLHGRVSADFDRKAFVRLVAESGLTGRGGAGFPMHRKLSSVSAAKGRPIVVANAAEGEPASTKDRALIALVPHLVLDGVQIAARTVGANEAIVYVGSKALADQTRRRVAQRAAARLDRVPVQVMEAARWFVAGQETAVVSALNGEPALPRSTPPPVYISGVDRRPTLVQNVETLAQLALVARYGSAWFRGLGTAAEPGTMLFTVSGDVGAPGVVEAPIGTQISRLLDLAGGVTEPLQALLIGGYHGSWLPMPVALDAPVSRAGLAPFGGSPGAGVVMALPRSACGLVEAARVTRYLADQSARQCGPCLNGLPALAAVLADLAAGRVHNGQLERAEQLNRLLEGRGACHHPDGSVRFVRSSLSVFADEVRLHLSNRCSAVPRRAPVLPTSELAREGGR